MFLVVILHVLSHGGVLSVSTGINEKIASLIDTFALCAVDVFAIISGFVSYSDSAKKFKSAGFIKLWLQVLTYSFGITLIVFIVAPESISIKTLIRSFFPIASNHYWYFSCYAALLLLTPWINHFIKSLDNIRLTQVVIALISIFSIYYVFVARLAPTDPFVVNYGYSVIWLTVLYVIGVWMKRCNIVNKIKTKYALLAIVASVLFTWVCKKCLPEPLKTGCFSSYTSPTILLISISYVVIFARMKFSKIMTKIIAFLSPAAFGIYLIHEQQCVRGHFISGKFEWIATLSPWLVPVAVIVSAAAVFVVCLSIERVRLSLFKVFRLNKLTEMLGAWIDKRINLVRKSIEKWSVN